MKNYFLSEIKPNDTMFFSHGWEIELYKDRFALNIPSDIPKEIKFGIRNHFNVFLRVARAVNTRDEFQEIWKRIKAEHWNHIIDNDLKSYDLIHWARQQLTDDEEFALFWRG